MMTAISKISVLGAGSWGTALAKHLADKHRALKKAQPITLWARRDAQVDCINREHRNPDYLKDITLPDNLVATRSIQEALAESDLVVGVIPTQATRAVLDEASPFMSDTTLWMSATKGIENNTLELVSDIYTKYIDKARYTALGGPSFAAEVARNMPSAVSIAGYDNSTTEQIQNAINTDYFRTYRTDDVVGVELAGALKNVVAIAAGISDGMGFGLNARAALITRGVAEITRIAVELGAHPLTLAGLSGMGDLVLTCTGNLSRNRTVGVELGKGKTLDEVLESMNMVAEGVKTTKSAYALAQKHGVEMPITEAVYRVLYENCSPKEEVYKLTSRPVKPERDDQRASKVPATEA